MNHLKDFTSNNATLCHGYLIRTYIPQPDVKKTLAALTEIVPLRYGCYENVAFHSAVGTQNFRPVTGAYLGDVNNVLDFAVVELIFTIDFDEKILQSIIDKLFKIHIAEEPVIYITESWSTRAKNYSDTANPNRFWNREDYQDEKK